MSFPHTPHHVILAYAPTMSFPQAFSGNPASLLCFYPLDLLLLLRMLSAFAFRLEPEYTRTIQ